jgi:hypothetical protein
VGAGVVVVFSAFVFVVFFTFVVFFFAFVVFSVFDSVGDSCAITGITSENPTANVNSIIKSFFMLGLDLLMDFFPFAIEQGLGHFSAITPDTAKQLEYQKL